MERDPIDLNEVECGLVTAPAGCGKTHTIASSLKKHKERKPVLILTHTHAGVAALRRRLYKESVPRSAYCLSTIDGWAMKLVQTFPGRSGVNRDALQCEHPTNDYVSIRQAAIALLASGHIADVISCTYARAVVDEYQDCGADQHLMISETAKLLPTCILGDPLQAIFRFSGDLVDWQEVRARFPEVRELTFPWRWKLVGADQLGEWLLDARARLLRGDPIDLTTKPDSVEWVELDGTSNAQRRQQAVNRALQNQEHKLLVLGDSTSKESRHQFTSRSRLGQVIEPVELDDLMAFASEFKLDDPDAIESIERFAKRVMTNISSMKLQTRIKSLERGSAKTAATDAEKAALSFRAQPSYAAAARLLRALASVKEPKVRVYRRTTLRAVLRALRVSGSTTPTSLVDAARHSREENRRLGQSLSRCSVGSTLLLKGLEGDAAVILDADKYDANNLYVAITRGAFRLTICSKSKILTPIR